MARYELNLRDYYRILRRHWIVIFVVSLGLGAITWYWSGDDDTSYQAHATVRIRQSSNLAGLLLQTFYWSPTDNIDTQIRLITSQRSLLEVAKKYDAAREVSDAIPDTTTYDLDLVFAHRDSFDHTTSEGQIARNALSEIGELSRRISAAQLSYSGLIEIAATSSDSEEDAIDLAKAAAEGFRQFSENSSTRQARETQTWIRDRLADLEDSIRTTQDDLQRARQQYQSFTSLDMATINPLITRRLDLSDRIATLSEQKARLEQGGSLSGVSSLQNTAALLSYGDYFRQLATLLADRSHLLLTYTEESRQIQAVDDRLAEIRSELIESMARDIGTYTSRLDSLDNILAEYPHDEIAYSAKQRRLEIYTQLQTQLQLQEQEANIREKDARGEVEIIDYPLGATETGGTSGREMKAVIGMLLGLMLGIVVAFIAESMDTSIGTIEDVEEYIEVPVLAVIPHLAVEKMEERLVEQNPELENDPNLHMYARLITQYDPKSPSAEAYRTLRTNLQFATAGAGEDMEVKNTFVFTSSDLQEGKSTTLVNLAITIAQAGNRVLLMGCNMRRPTIYKSFGLTLETGMTDILTGSKEWRECVKGVTDMMIGPLSLQNIMSMPGLDNLHIVTAGGVPPNPSELLNSKRFGQMIEEASEEYDIVLVDCPPILPVTDAAIVGRQVDWAVLIYQVGKVARNALRRAKLHLSNVGAHVLGIAMNDVRAEISGYSPYSQYMTKYYGEGAGEKKSFREWVRGLFKKEEIFEDRRTAPRPETHRIEGRDDSGPAWIEVDYFGSGESQDSGDASISSLPFAADAPAEPERDEADSAGDHDTGDATGILGNGNGEDGERTGFFAAVPLWGWIALAAALIVLVVSLVLGSCSETRAGVMPATPDPAAPAGTALASEPAGSGVPSVNPSDPVDASDPGGTVWSVLVGSFPTTAAAEAFLESLQSADPARAATAWSRTEDIPELGQWNRVYIGQFSERAECERSARSLAASGLYALTLSRRVTPPAP